MDPVEQKKSPQLPGALVSAAQRSTKAAEVASKALSSQGAITKQKRHGHYEFRAIDRKLQMVFVSDKKPICNVLPWAPDIQSSLEKKP